MSTGFSVVPASYVYLLRDGPAGTEVLLQKRRNTGYMDDHWAAAAGHVERGETALEAARREVAEEIGVDDVSLDFVTTMHRTANDRPVDERVDFFFSCRRWEGDPRIVEPVKCADLRWWDLERLPDPVVPHELSVLRTIASGTATPYSTYGFERTS